MEREKVLELEQEASPPNKKLKASQKSNGSKISEFCGAGELKAVPVKLEGSQAESNSEESIHPLLVDHILENIFKMIIDPLREREKQKPDVAAISRDVQNFRLVCKTWSEVSTKVFRKARSIMNIGGEEIMEYPDFKLERFLETMGDSCMIPVHSYRINRGVLTPQNSLLIKRFLEICGPGIVELHVSIHDGDVNSTFEIPGEVSHLKLEKLSTFLISIRCNHGRVKQKGQHRDVAHFIAFLMSISENLKDFTMAYGLCCGASEGIEKVFQQLPSSLKSIKLYTSYRNFYLNIIQKKRMQLETFAFRFYGEQVFPSWDETIYAFFQEQSKTLKKLSLPTVCLTVQPESEKPIVFGQLNSLKVQMRQLPLSFPDRFPKLTDLDLSNVSYEPYCMELLSVTAPSQTVTELHFPCTSVGANTAMKLAECFPNVRKIHLARSAKFTGAKNPFEHVFVYFPNIEELVISLNCFNQRVTGYGESFLWNDHCYRTLFFRDVNHFYSKMIEKKPSILLLKKLRKLVLKDCNGIKFTDFAAQFFFLKMESLEELYIDSGFDFMSADYVTRLKNKLKIMGE